MPHLVARDQNGNYVPHDHPDATVEQISGILIHVASWNDEPRGPSGQHVAHMYVPAEHVDQIIAKSLSNQGRDVQSGDRAWDHCEVISDEHDHGPGGPNQLWHDDVPDGVTVALVHPTPEVLPEGVNS